MPFNPNLTVDKVAPELMRDHRSMNAGRYAEPLIDDVQEIAEQRKVYIFNVGPWPHVRMLGSLGQVYIRSCPPDKEYSEPVVVPGIVREHYPINEMENKNLDSKGWDLAQQILGIGPHLAPRDSFVRFGVFATRNQKPNKDELAKANQAFDAECLRLIAEADAALAQGPKAAEETIRPETHFIAARRLHKTEVECPWLRNAQLPAERSACFNCGTVYKVGISQCPQCKAILDRAKYDKAVKEGLILAS